LDNWTKGVNLRYAAIDIGTNTARLLVADTDADGLKHDLKKRVIITRLGQGVDETRQFAPEAVIRTLEAIAEYADEIERLGAEEVRAIATSAARDAENSGEFIDAASNILGVKVDVISGLEEAGLSYLGATTGFPFKSQDDPVLVFDIGGGSTELIYGRGKKMERAISLDIGSVRLTELFVKNDPPSLAELTLIREDVHRQVGNGLTEINPERGGLTVIGVAGTVTTIQAVKLGLEHYYADAIHLTKLTEADVRETLDLFLSMKLEERQDLPGLEPKRADVIIAGAIITETVLEESGASEMTVSDNDILDGVVINLARRS
jgi:exopolyphosphatase / guanosine-5'-triphosphate,3'-diphosphate pyrophosphatase